jgi:hypothetical protein
VSSIVTTASRAPGAGYGQSTRLQVGPVVLGRLPDDLGEIAPLLVELELLPGDAGDVEQVVDQPRHVRDLAIDHVAGPRHGRLRRPEPAQDVDGVADRGEGVAQLVGEDGQKFVLAPVGLAERLLGLALGGDVGVGPEPPLHLAGIVADGHGARQEPAVGAVLAAQGERVLPGLAGLDVAAELRDDVVGVVDLLPAPAGHLLEGRPRVIEPALVVPDEVSALVADPGELRHVVGQRAEALLALPDGGLGLDQLGDVHLRDDRAHDVPLGVADRGGGVEHRPARPRGVEGLDLDDVVAGDLPAQGPRHRPLVRLDPPAVPLGAVGPPALPLFVFLYAAGEGGAAPQALVGGVHAQQLAVRVGHDDACGRRLQDGVEQAALGLGGGGARAVRGALAIGDVLHQPPEARRPPLLVALAPPAHLDPALLAVGAADVALEGPVGPVGDRPLDLLVHARAILVDDVLEEEIVAPLRDRRGMAEDPGVAGRRPRGAGGEVQLERSAAAGLDHELPALLALPHRRDLGAAKRELLLQRPGLHDARG